MSTTRILLMDDDEAVRDELATLLERDGYRVIQAPTGQLALDLALRHKVDAFLLEMNMPDMSGIDVCRKIRRISAYEVTPIFFITGSSERDQLAKTFLAGGDDFVSKPVDGTVLRVRLQGHLRRMEYFNQVQRMQQLLQQYVSRRTIEIVEKAALTGIVPGPVERDVAICFTDIRGFTALAEEMDATSLFALISSRLAQQVRLVYEHGGYIDKFGGDGIMAVFDGTDGVQQSCLCALSIIEDAKTELLHPGLGQMGIGIHCGHAVIGNIGSSDHLDYSVIGTTVNIAARLCGHAEPMSIVVSKAVRDLAFQDCRFSFHDERQVPIRGLKLPTTVYALTPKPAAGQHP